MDAVTYSIGGRQSSGGGFVLNGTVAEHATGALCGQSSQLTNGFWLAYAGVPATISINQQSPIGVTQ